VIFTELSSFSAFQFGGEKEDEREREWFERERERERE
jgi:hypothetical protein